MRIHHFLFWFFTTVGVSSFDHDLQNRTNLFIKDRLIPTLKLKGVRTVNFNHLKLCLCSSEVGCVARTRGWIATIGEGLTSEEKMLYGNTCYTDGICYQNLHYMDSLTDFGCIDRNRKKSEMHFHDATSNVCQNTTKGKQISSWICCQNDHFCANSTELITGRHIIGSTKFWLITTTILIVFFIILILILTRRSIMKSKLFKSMFRICKIDTKYYQQEDFNEAHIHFHKSDEEKLVSAESEQTSSQRPTAEKPNSDQVNTMSTMVSEAPDPLANIAPVDHHVIRQVTKILDFIDETGSGIRHEEGTPRILTEATLANKTILGYHIGEGRYGKVYVGLYNSKRVAVKTVDSREEEAFTKEVAILRETRMNHDNILRYYGATRKVARDNAAFENWIITDYHEKGSLYQYLLENSVDFETCLKMIRSMANGLDYLHSELTADGDAKLRIAHRDIKSRNILVKMDNTCCIADFGLTIISPPRGIEIPEATVRSFRCGTVRYLAPEILDGSLVARSFDSYTQADVYSFSLVMWETLARCNYQNIEAREPENSVPYVEFTTRDPLDPQMFDVVCAKQLRPTYSPSWLENEDYKRLLEIMSVCWSANRNVRYKASMVASKVKEVEQDYLERHDPTLKPKRLKEEEEVETWKKNHAEAEERRMRNAIAHPLLYVDSKYQDAMKMALKQPE